MSMVRKREIQRATYLRQIPGAYSYASCEENLLGFLDTGPAALMLLLCCEKRARGPLNTRHLQVLASRLNIYSQSRVTIMRHVMANIVLKLVTILPAKFFFKSTEFIFGCPLV